MRNEILALFSGTKGNSIPAFSGLIHLTAEGLASEGLVLHEVHTNAEKMARAAASTFKLAGMPSATLPLDLCYPAEALGAELNYYENGEIQFPQVKKLLFQSTREILEIRELEISGRSGLICDAIQFVKKDIGDQIVISGMIPGPYTLLIYICKVQNLFLEMKKEPQMVLDALFHLSSFLAQIGNTFREAGADFITVHEMGGSPGFIGPAKFEQFVLPALQELHAKLPSPRVLSVCGDVSKSFAALSQTGAEAIAVDQTVDLAAARVALQGKLLFGNLDPIRTLFGGNEDQIHEAVHRAKEAGADAVMPGCDLVIQTPIKNLRTMLE
jgi:[methyl-Co(III) methanol-specific corrinoid protein]:coenzyme M methyltransferase